MSQDNIENVPKVTDEGTVETEKRNLTKALEKGELFAKFPLSKDLGSHKSEAFKIFHLIYDEENKSIQN